MKVVTIVIMVCHTILAIDHEETRVPLSFGLEF